MKRPKLLNKACFAWRFESLSVRPASLKRVAPMASAYGKGIGGKAFVPASISRNREAENKMAVNQQVSNYAAKPQSKSSSLAIDHREKWK